MEGRHEEESSRSNLLKNTSKYREESDSGEAIAEILKQYAISFQSRIAHTFSIDSNDVRVMIFAQHPPSDPDFIREIVASGKLGREIKFEATPKMPEKDTSSSDKILAIDSIIACAIYHRSYVLWEGEDSQTVQNIRSWNEDGLAQGTPVVSGKGAVTGIEIDNIRCQHEIDPEEPVLRKKMLCGPIGAVPSANIDPHGGLCILITKDLDIFEDPVSIRLMRQFGEILAPFNLNQIIPDSSDEGGNGS